MTDAGARERRVSTVVAAAALALLVLGLLAVRMFSDPQPQAGASASGRSPTPTATPTSLIRPLPERHELVDPTILRGLRFRDVTARAGLSGRADAHAEDARSLDGGIAVADLDGDGDQDLLLTSAGSASGLYRNDHGRFRDVTRGSGLTRMARSTVARLADVDGDGDLDAFLGGPAPSFGRLYVNEGGWHFIDRSNQSGVVGRAAKLSRGRVVRGADFGDVDGDGDLDLLVTDWNASIVVAADAAGARADLFPNQCQFSARLRLLWSRGDLTPTGDSRLFINDGQGRFRDGTDRWGLMDLGLALPLTPQFQDLDGDGRVDLAVTGDACTSRLYRNEGRRFRNVTALASVGTAENGMGSVLADLDGDARADWMVTAISYPSRADRCPRISLFDGCSGNRVYLNRGGLRFRDATDALGLRASGWGWGVSAADLANDGSTVLAVTNGWQAPASDDRQREVYVATFRDDPTRLYLPDGAGRYVDAAHDAGIDDHGLGQALVTFDYDGDGRLDVLIAHGHAPPTLYRNVTPASRHWLEVRLHDGRRAGNPGALGARVEVRGGTHTSVRWMLTSGSYEAQGPASLHFGLGTYAGPVRVSVRWPGEARPEHLRVGSLDRVVTLERGSG